MVFKISQARKQYYKTLIEKATGMRVAELLRYIRERQAAGAHLKKP